MARPDYTAQREAMRAAKLVRTPPRFTYILQSALLTTPNNLGICPDEPGMHAAWYYCRCAIQNAKKWRSGADYEGERDHVPMYGNLLISIALMYDLESPGVILKFLGLAKLQAEAMEYEWYEEIMHPGLIEYVNQGN